MQSKPATADTEDSAIPQQALIRPRLGRREMDIKVAIVASQYHLDYVQPMTEFAFKEIDAIGRVSNIELFWTPGTYELPVVANALAKTKKYDAILAFGLLFQGETTHADLIASSVTQAFLDIALATGVPVLNGVVTAATAEIAHARCIDPEKNRGIETARAAISLSKTLKKIYK